MQTPLYVLDNFNDAKVRKLIIVIQSEKSEEKKNVENSLSKINEEILLTNWINKINLKKQYYNRVKLKEANIKDMRDMTLRELLPKLNIEFAL